MTDECCDQISKLNPPHHVDCQMNVVHQIGGSAPVRVQAGPARLTRCAAACVAAAPRAALCENKQQQIELDPSFTFWAYLAVSI